MLELEENLRLLGELKTKLEQIKSSLKIDLLKSIIPAYCPSRKTFHLLLTANPTFPT